MSPPFIMSFIFLAEMAAEGWKKKEAISKIVEVERRIVEGKEDFMNLAHIYTLCYKNTNHIHRIL